MNNVNDPDMIKKRFTEFKINMYDLGIDYEEFNSERVYSFMEFVTLERLYLEGVDITNDIKKYPNITIHCIENRIGVLSKNFSMKYNSARADYVVFKNLFGTDKMPSFEEIFDKGSLKDVIKTIEENLEH